MTYARNVAHALRIAPPCAKLEQSPKRDGWGSLRWLARAGMPGRRVPSGRALQALALSGAVLAGSAVTPAAAQLMSSSERVSYADINLDTQAGRDTLLERTNAASGRVCTFTANQGEGATERRNVCIHQSQTHTASHLVKIMNAPH